MQCIFANFVRSLAFERHHFDLLGAQSLGHVLQGNATLTSLNLRGNALGGRDMGAPRPSDVGILRDFSRCAPVFFAMRERARA